jgi:hypothetical protein
MVSYGEEAVMINLREAMTVDLIDLIQGTSPLRTYTKII